MTQHKPKSLMRNLGEFFGHIARGVKTDPAREKHEVRRDVEEHHEHDEQGRKVTVRRTTIEEIEIEHATRPAAGPASQGENDA